jgi:hypothetical protein
MGKPSAFALLGPVLMFCGCLAVAAAGLSGLGVLPGAAPDARPAAESLAAQAFPSAGR